MNDQLSLPGFGAAPSRRSPVSRPRPSLHRTPPRIDRLFYAIILEPETAIQACRLAHRTRARFGLSGWPLRADRLHVSLHSLGDYRNGLPDSIVATATRVGERVVYHLFDVAFDRVESFSTNNRRRPLVLLGSDKLAELHDFQQAVGAAMNEVGLGFFVATNFNPHVTLLYDERLVVGPQFIAPVKWAVRDFVLVHSLVGRTQHIHLARWPLAWRCP